ncbi:MAG: GTPase HflX [Loktanella sp.]|nr:GTPase HflX [Loktanella sp.]MDO7623746.1 GTPase HflX [Loktanella sp.]MDO7626942.1 GTPase HflX [Loktanella sp.]MDO7665158.1 GTPase HflX [Loktanella sp.]MDO7684005.1 GTPase HflX [Loktanella sp.]
MQEHDKLATRAWVLHPDLKSDFTRRDAIPALEEAVALAAALPDIEVVGSTSVRLPKRHAGMLFGKGKIEELRVIFKEAEVELVLIDGAVTPVQQRNLEKAWDVKVLDRTGLILEIFSDRARTSEGVLQVEMAALSYQRTRLVRAWTHLERQRGGMGFMGGPGETQIESDRRAIDDHLVRLRDKLAKVVKTRALHRASRAKVPYPIVALVGYTNAGKSTLFNRLTGADVFVKDMLFATLDPTMRKIELPSGDEIIMSDTVGFISDLPTELVAAFRATLEEVLDADLIVHVRDISHAQTEEQAKNVKAILGALGVSETAPMIEVWNKIDKMPEDERAAVEAQSARTDDLFAISAVTGDGMDDLLGSLAEHLKDPRRAETFTLSYAEGRKRAWLFEQGIVTEEVQDENGYTVSVFWTIMQKERYSRL